MHKYDVPVRVHRQIPTGQIVGQVYHYTAWAPSPQIAQYMVGRAMYKLGRAYQIELGLIKEKSMETVTVQLMRCMICYGEFEDQPDHECPICHNTDLQPIN